MISFAESTPVKPKPVLKKPKRLSQSPITAGPPPLSAATSSGGVEVGEISGVGKNVSTSSPQHSDNANPRDTDPQVVDHGQISLDKMKRIFFFPLG